MKYKINIYSNQIVVLGFVVTVINIIKSEILMPRLLFHLVYASASAHTFTFKFAFTCICLCLPLVIF